ncbi:hypothetical protein ELH72_30075 (plasmid) [Rhizobium ruizarguesonis]|uniref:hypothetical protein n=1 Tax=Rhizobium ruizarguesonis TaxID=2081791 RepID=UPI001032289A|nr:hypothetical protein [Rhizobium ruizarguesonis]TAZ71162.1 hypothetical protein ELH72_30075 [Rhizobium ruizarguesonis]
MTIDTPTGLKSGTEVIEIKAEFYSKGSYIGNAGRVDISGEAGVIEVSPNKYLFILLKGFDLSTASLTFIPKSPPEEKAAVAEKKRYTTMEDFGKTIRTTELSPNLYPVFVTFRDVADPTSLVVVNPTNLSKDFGQGVKLRSVTLTVSPEEPIPDRVHAILPWLEAVGQQRGGIIPTTKQFESELSQAEKIRPSDFITFDRWRRD